MKLQETLTIHLINKYCRSFLTGIMHVCLAFSTVLLGLYTSCPFECPPNISQGKFFHSTESGPQLIDQKPYFVMIVRLELSFSKTKIIKFKKIMYKNQNVKFNLNYHVDCGISSSLLSTSSV